MKISVVIPFYKYKLYLTDCLGSLALSDTDDFETILVLDQVTEDIDDLIEEHKEKLNLKVVENPAHGVCSSRNLGIANATGDYILLLDSDDYVLENTISEIIKAAKANPGVDLISCNRYTTWNKRLNFIEQDRTEKDQLKKEAHDSWNQKFEDYFRADYPDVSENDKIVYINLLLENRSFFSISALKHVYRKDFLTDNEICFDEKLVSYADAPFLVDVVNAKPSIVECKEAAYVKRRHNDPYNFPAHHTEQEDKKHEQRFLSYKDAIDRAKDPLTKQILEAQICKYTVKTVLKWFRRSTNKKEKWTREYDRYQPEIAKVSPNAIKNLSDYQRKAIELMQKDDRKALLRHIGKKNATTRVKRMFRKKNLNEVYKALYTRVYYKQPIKKNLVMFESFFGKGYSDSPKYVYEYLAKNYGDKYEFVWVLNNDTKPPYGGKVVKRFSREYVKYLATAQYLIFNVRQPQFYKPREGQTFVETWHGTPLKRLVFDQEEVLSASPKYKIQFYKQRQQWDYLVAANKFSSDTFRSCFMYDGEMLDIGYPRNDLLYDPNKDEIAVELRKKLGIPLDKKTILYAPTWRDDESYGKGEYKFTLALDLHRLKEEFSDEYVVLLRTHYYIADKIDVTGLEGFVYNLSDYNDITELYLISDICITDYSSVFFDYGNLKRPELFFVYDYERYRDQLRGFYISMQDDLPGPLLYTNDDVVEAIKNIDQITEEYKDKYEVFYERFCTYDDGNASKRLVERVFGEK